MVVVRAGERQRRLGREARRSAAIRVHNVDVTAFALVRSTKGTV
jgi:hypothetical protein